jgi:DNA mismatch repair protein MSH5
MTGHSYATKADGISRLINADTLAALQIMQSESHPHSHNQGPTSSGSKEGLSVYGLFHHLAKTPQGKFLLRQYFLRPTLDLEVILERHRAVSVFLRPNNEAYMSDLIKSLKQIKNMKTVMIHLHKGMNSTLTNGGGIKSGTWSTLRSVSIPTCMYYHCLVDRKIVSILYNGHQESFHRDHRS